MTLPPRYAANLKGNVMEHTAAALASRPRIRPPSIRAAVCRKGSHYGVTPTRLPNGHLWWPSGAFDRIKNGSQK